MNLKFGLSVLTGITVLAIAVALALAAWAEGDDWDDVRGKGE